eukprot:1926135-Alexandrium_andersonii.AAC.1
MVLEHPLRMVRNPAGLVKTANGQPLGLPAEMLALPLPGSARACRRGPRGNGVAPAWARS